MLKRFKSIFLCTLLFSGSLFANFGPGFDGECSNSCCSSWKIDAEFLYFLPTFDDTYFVLRSPVTTGFPNGERLNNDFDFRPGFRVGAAYEMCGCCDGELQAYYTRLSSNRTRTVTGSFLWATVGRAAFTSNFENYTGSASSDLDFLYQRVDGLYSHRLWCNNCVRFEGSFGLEYTHIRLTEQYEFINGGVVGLVDQRTKTCGIGPQFGFNFDYLICQTSCWCPGALSVAACSSGSLIASRNQLYNRNTLTGVPILDVSDERTWRIIPALHARIGLNYAACFSCFGASIELGYEFTSYLRAISRSTFPDDVGDSLCLTNYYNFDVQGLYVALNVSF